MRGYMTVPLVELKEEKACLTAFTWGAVRQEVVLVVEAGHWRGSGLKLQRSGSSISPSAMPSMASHCLRTS
jgi:hypothetical protein